MRMDDARQWSASMSLVELGRYDRNLANIIVGRLDAEGLDAIAFDGGASIADGSYLLIPVRVMVDEDDIAAARRIVAAAQL
jgi:hypothetical protein